MIVRIKPIAHSRAVAVDGQRLAASAFSTTSGEPKAVATAQILAAALGLSIEVREDLHENDRSATDFLQPDEFDAVADQFFAAPAASARGWERALDVKRGL